MTSGKNHTKLGLLVLYILFSMWLIFSGLISLFILVTAFVFGLIFLSPDLDIKNSNPYKAWGPFRILWWPFQKLMKHRGLSHHLVLGPGILIGYFLILITVPAYILGIELNNINFDYVFWFIAGTVIAIELHILIDKVRIV